MPPVAESLPSLSPRWTLSLSPPGCSCSALVIRGNRCFAQTLASMHSSGRSLDSRLAAWTTPKVTKAGPSCSILFLLFFFRCWCLDFTLLIVKGVSHGACCIRVDRGELFSLQTSASAVARTAWILVSIEQPVSVSAMFVLFFRFLADELLWN